MEIERKWLLTKEPIIPLAIFKVVTTRQIYLSGIRIRKTETAGIDGYKYFMAVKDNGTISRQEWEIEIPEWVFIQLDINNPHEPSIFKTVYKSRLGDLVLEFHVFKKDLNGLIILECEFQDEATAKAFDLPDEIQNCVIKEVTEDRRYQNSNLAVYGLPQ